MEEQPKTLFVQELYVGGKETGTNYHAGMYDIHAGSIAGLAQALAVCLRSEERNINYLPNQDVPIIKGSRHSGGTLALSVIRGFSEKELEILVREASKIK